MSKSLHILTWVGFVFTVIFLLTATISYADDISISANVDKTEISLADQITLTITVSGNVSNIPQPRIPRLSGFTAYSSGRSQNISIINGQVTSSITFTYILVPTAVGEYTLGPFTVEYRGKTYSTGSIDVKVIPRAQRPVQPSAPAYPQPPSEPYQKQAPPAGKELFIETYVDKLRAYVNEQITLTFAFYQSVDLFQNPVYTPPSTTGFWTEDMPPQRKYYKIINGRKYLVTEIKTALFGTSPGEFTIGPARLEATVEDLQKFFSSSPFDIFDRDPFSIFKEGKPIILTTEPIHVEILPLPEEGKSGNFKGDVGKFDISASVDKTTVEENQPITLRIKIKGEGNIKTISSPDIPEIKHAKLYDSGSSENISKANYVVQGEKDFEKVIIPKEAGSFTIGPIEYSYFNPVDKRYVVKKTPIIKIDVTESKEKPTEAVTPPVAGLTKEEVKLLKKDIAYIKTGPVKLRPMDSFLYKNRIFLSFNAIPLFLLLFLYIYESHRERLRKDIVYARSRRARGQASKRLRKAKSLLVKEDIAGFYAEIYKAVIEYIADRMNIPHPSITKETLQKKLLERAVSSDTIEKLNKLFDICDMARFASGRFTKEDMNGAFKLASEVIVELERRI